jgi:hypothetical protein
VWTQGGILIGRPFTETYGKDHIPEDQWDKPWFKRSFMIFSSFWLVAFFIMAVSNTVGPAPFPEELSSFPLHRKCPVPLNSGKVLSTHRGPVLFPFT